MTTLPFIPSVLIAMWLISATVNAVSMISNTTVKRGISRASTSWGYNYESCNKDAMECKSPRTCVREDSLATCRDMTGCVCLDKSSVACTGSNDCLPGDRCVEFPDGKLCYSCDMVANGDVNGKPTDSGFSCTWLASLCIAVDGLSDFSKHSLVYKVHRKAVVLCDRNHSCATPGHVVIYEGVPMLMQSYCKLRNDCNVSVSLVNSPKYERALRIPSRTEQLEYTSLSSRYALRFEEIVLSKLIHFGL